MTKNIKNINIKSICATLFISLFLSCNNSGESAEAEQRLNTVLMDVGRSAEDAFYSFIDLISDTLGLRVTAGTTKNKIGEYFSGLGEKLGKAADQLEEVAVKAVADVDTDGLLNKAIKEAVDTAKGVLDTLKGHLESLKDIGDANQKVGETENTSSSAKEGKAADDAALKKVYKALKGIVDIAITDGSIKALESGSITLQATNSKDGAKILATDQSHKPGAAVGDKAAVILSKVSGAEMLASIVNSKEEDPQLTKNATGETTAMSFARGNKGGDYLAQDDAKAAAVAGGIALRSLVKTSTLAANNSGDDKTVQASGVTAVNKLLGAVEDIIKKAVKNILKAVKEKIDQARTSKISVSELGQQ
ncbi:variable large family protein (plasmid) [Borrelia coriaceae]|uniref:Variable large protein n=1 Tax=Borrelia coriaceae ATCC 43381 TaxID=1408429 RepID=W5SXT7_9SPIR|nr:Variable major outer membrane lipoprotein [Borrelia coriaceae ATCC 43381]UPA17186.1 variable large family protein [Borrelia coriaceae]